MDKLTDLKDLLRHEIEDLYSAEQQIIDALPGMIGKAGNNHLKLALKQHLDVTRTHLSRLNKVQELLQPDPKDAEAKPRSFLSKLFGGPGVHKCKGTEGLIREGEHMMKEDMDPQVMDAVIIACAQKIEHYEICGYGTARAYARELKLNPVERLLADTLSEEYAADDRLTQLAVQGGVNRKAENARPARTRAAAVKSAPKKTGRKPASAPASKKKGSAIKKKPVRSAKKAVS